MTPTDELAFVDCPPPLLAMPEVDEVHISVAFTWDMPKAERLALVRANLPELCQQEEEKHAVTA